MYQIEALGPDDELSAATSYPNPFVGKAHVFQPQGLLVITGLPGIVRLPSLLLSSLLNDPNTGKTMFLALIFHLRMAANLPTLHMVTESYATVYVHGAVWTVSADALPNAFGMKWIPDETWCLLDCNTRSRNIPGTFVQASRYIVIAASPRGENLLATKDFTTHARHAYLDSGDKRKVADFEERINRAALKLSKIDKDIIRSSLTASAMNNFTLVIPDEVCHMLLSIFPTDDQDRTVFTVKSPSEAMTDKALAILAHDLPTARQEFFQFCVGVQNAAARGWSATLFNRFYHDILIAGGVWLLNAMKQGTEGSKNTWWEVDESTAFLLCADKELCIHNTNNTLDHEPVSLNSVRLPEGENRPAMPGVYYIPDRQNFPTFDSFYIDKPGHAFGFQASITLDGHIKPSGVEWLQTHGIVEITYILITPDTIKGRRRVKMPHALANGLHFDLFCHVALPF
ncbi:hypothetical protein DFH07DRAFT_857710 [Mycena maculata]|uniref:Uncharacterized protein n=1 Tax=Mycena maculata TaxID=230809 RepID=A0AAD7HIV6_9AGAR|nr:hypothetical protein DFH07DRAFT_857710 [Mycena maculata]